MVIVKRIDHNKELSLGSDVVKESNAYTYLGLYFRVLATTQPVISKIYLKLISSTCSSSFY